MDEINKQSDLVSEFTHYRRSGFLQKLGMRKLDWRLRRVGLKLPSNALVLEVGSGGNPFPRANVLLDAYEATRERHWEPLISDRPTVLAFGEKLPFKDNAFDFVIAAHVLEHSKDPAKFIAELQRVGKAGYIETPHAILERLNPYKDHRLELSIENDRLIIKKKTNWIVDTEVNKLYEDRIKDIAVPKLMEGHPDRFHVQFFWKDQIDYEIVNPEADTDWEAPVGKSSPLGATLKGKIYEKLRSIPRRLTASQKSNQSLDLLSLLDCPACHKGNRLEGSLEDEQLRCKDCGAEFGIRAKVPDFTKI